jgi:hypothetical protein
MSTRLGRRAAVYPEGTKGVTVTLPLSNIAFCEMLADSRSISLSWVMNDAINMLRAEYDRAQARLADEERKIARAERREEKQATTSTFTTPPTDAPFDL